MSEENVKAVERANEGGNRGDPTPLLEIADEAVVFEPLRANVEGAYHGHDGIRDFTNDTTENFELFEVRYTDVRDLEDRVLTIGTVRVRGTGSGAEAEVPTAAIWAFREGRLVNYKDYGDKRTALEAAGLSE
jgi:ketosteroid isomerase-like protein